LKSPRNSFAIFSGLFYWEKIEICHNSDPRPPKHPRRSKLQTSGCFQSILSNEPTGAEYIEYEEREKYTCFIKVPMLHPPRGPRTYGVLKGVFASFVEPFVPACYEAFLLCAQLLWVACTFPQASAEISKTGSNRKEGAV
jgi:hypothetical protein